MIQAYKANNTNFAVNGDVVLLPTTCDLKCGINDMWELTMTHPMDSDGRWENLEEGGILAAPTFQSNKQLFRITKIEKNEASVSVTASPKFFDSANDCFLMDVRPTNKNGQDALNILTSGSKYSAESDIQAIRTAYFVRRNLMDAINGESDPTFIGTWGGEILYDNDKVIINSRIGADNGVDIRYGKNMNGLQYSVDMSNVITRIVPVAYNGRMIDSSTPWVDSENIDKYPIIYTREVKFEDVKLASDLDESGALSSDIVCDTQAELNVALTQKCNDMYEAGSDLPSVTIQINMIDLSNTAQYQDFSGLVSIGLGDTVHCYNTRLKLSTDARVISLTWDCIKNQAKSLILGDYEYNYFSALTLSNQAVNKVIGPGDTILAERVKGILNAMETQFRAQKNIAQTQDVRAMLFEDLNPDSPTFGALSIGTQGIQISRQRNSQNTDWVWTTAIDAAGIVADVIVTGLLSSVTGDFSIDLETGVLKTTKSTTYDVSNYSQSDLDRMQQIVVGNIPPTQEDLDKYDFYGDGEVSITDVVNLNHMLQNNVSLRLVWEITINPSNKYAAFQASCSTYWDNEYASTSYSTQIGANLLKIQRMRFQDQMIGWRTTTIDGQTITYLGPADEVTT